MNSTSLSITITAKSNLFLGGIPSTYEIGGIDLHTAVDHAGRPVIPASALKGALRTIIRDIAKGDDPTAQRIAELYVDYLNSRREVLPENLKDDEKERVQKRFQEKIDAASCLYLFGIEGFNNTPKIFISDFVVDQSADPKTLFSIDAKNTIDDRDGISPKALPRIYKAVRQGIQFTGHIRFHQMEQLGEEAIVPCKSVITGALLKFNDGVYRIGNSKSRGYGLIVVQVDGKDEVASRA